MKLKPFFQGKLDTFCAIYAVLNGLRLTHGIRTTKARELLNETLLGVSANPVAFRAVLNQQTDYIALVDAMLNVAAKKYPLQVIRPFTPADWPDTESFWEACLNWLNPVGAPAADRAIILRFSRYNQPGHEPLVRHWTTVDKITEDSLHLFDSSHDAESIQNIRKDSIVTNSRDIDEAHLLYLQPDSVRFMRLPF